MKQIRHIFRLHLADPTLSIRSIALASKVSRPVVSSYLKLLSQHPLTLEKLNLLNDSELKNHLNLHDSSYELSKEKKQLIKWLIVHIDELQKIGVTRKLLHERYLETYPDGLSYSRFAFTIQSHFKEKGVSGLLEHKIADKLYLDYVGKKFIWKDYQNNTHTEEVFLATLGASGYLYAIPSLSQRAEEFCYCVEQAFIHLGGVPRAVVPDCLKSAVISHDGYESKPNQLFLALLKHYNCVSIPARPRHPKDKAPVEGSVNLIYRQIYARSYDLVFENRNAMLTWWFKALDEINDKSFQKIKGSRKSRFLEQEKDHLKPLPEHTFEMISILQQTISSTCVVYIPQDKTRYSVPFTLIGETVDVHVYATMIEIWHDGQRKAMHTRQKEKDLVINPAHQHKNIAWYAQRNIDELIRELSMRGTHVASFAHAIVEKALHEDSAWQSLEGLKKVYKKYIHRVDTACRIALKNNYYTVQKVKKILKEEEDLLLKKTEEQTLVLPFHTNIRGASYYTQSEVQA